MSRAEAPEHRDSSLGPHPRRDGAGCLVWQEDQRVTFLGNPRVFTCLPAVLAGPLEVSQATAPSA